MQLGPARTTKGDRQKLEAQVIGRPRPLFPGQVEVTDGTPEPGGTIHPAIRDTPLSRHAGPKIFSGIEPQNLVRQLGHNQRAERGDRLWDPAALWAVEGVDDEQPLHALWR